MGDHGHDHGWEGSGKSGKGSKSGSSKSGKGSKSGSSKSGKSGSSKGSKGSSKSGKSGSSKGSKSSDGHDHDDAWWNSHPADMDHDGAWWGGDDDDGYGYVEEAHDDGYSGGYDNSWGHAEGPTEDHHHGDSGKSGKGRRRTNAIRGSVKK